ncbi:MAG: FMN-binding protein [Coriobacteriaceae bacterium]|nr:FMN-binding protein [Coriobacteriaceae bacterium]
MKKQTIARLALPLAVAAGLGLGCVPAVQAFTNVLTPAQAWAATDVSYNNGTYTAEGKGIGGKVPVTVTVKDGKIAEVTVGDNSETQGIGSKAIEQLPAKIVEAGGTEGVDAVSGASVTSKAIFTAVEDCLKQAK